MTKTLMYCFKIYNEMIRDLLNPSSGYLELREDSKGEIRIAGITEFSTCNAKEVHQEYFFIYISFIFYGTPIYFLYVDVLLNIVSLFFQIMSLLTKGNKQRTQESTAANKTSSRSHAILQVSAEQTDTLNGYMTSNWHTV